MNVQTYKLLLACALVAGLGGCNTVSAIKNVSQVPVATAGKAATTDDVQKAIIRAGAALGWQVKPTEPGIMIGTLNLRTHMAMIEIKYDTQSYSITYKDSANLDYNGKYIHKNYNGWIENLDKGIRTQLALN